MFDLSGRIVVVTGASKGMGFAIARTFGATGAMVIVSARAKDAAAAAAALLQTERIEVRGLALDVTEQQSVAEFSANALAAFGRIDVLVLNAAANTPNGPLLSQHPDELGKVMRNNVQANLAIVNAVAPPDGRAQGRLIDLHVEPRSKTGFAETRPVSDGKSRRWSVRTQPRARTPPVEYQRQLDQSRPGPNGLLENSLGRSESRSRYRRGDPDAAFGRAF
jgi:hypothetical protein